jgi:hypothetical protein
MMKYFTLIIALLVCSHASYGQWEGNTVNKTSSQLSNECWKMSGVSIIESGISVVEEGATIETPYVYMDGIQPGEYGQWVGIVHAVRPNTQYNPIEFVGELVTPSGDIIGKSNFYSKSNATGEGAVMAPSNYIGSVKLVIRVTGFKSGSSLILDTVKGYGAVLSSSPCSGIDAPIAVFNAIKGKSGLLTWETSSETKALHFIIEESFDNNIFAEIGSIPANGTTTSISAYKATIKPSKGVVYYRIKAIGDNGRYSVSETISVTQGSFKNHEWWSFLDNETPIRLLVYDLKGRLIKEYKNSDGFDGLFDSKAYIYRLETTQGFRTLRVYQPNKQ